MNQESRQRPPGDSSTSYAFQGELILDSAPIAILILDSRMQIRYANPEAVSLFGYDKDDLLRQPMSMLVPDDSRGPHAESIQSYLENPTRKIMGAGKDTLVRHKDGHEFPAEIHLGPMTHDGQEMVVCTVRDISLRLGAQRQIEHAERQVRVITDALPVLIAQLDPEGRFRFVNAEFERAYGETKEWFIGRSLKELLPPEKYQQLLVGLANAGEQRLSAMKVDVDFPAAGPCSLFVEVIKETDQDGRVDGYYALASDVRQRRQIEATLRLHSQVLDDVHDAIVSTDLEGFVTSWNQAAQRMSGYTEAEALGRHIGFVYAEEDQAFLDQSVIAPLRSKGAHEVEARMLRRDGDIFFANLSLSLLRDAGGQPMGMIGYSADITDRKEAELALARSNQRLTETLESISDAFYALDENWRFTYVNSRALEMAGRPASEMLGEEIWSVFPNIVGTELEATFRRARSEGKPIELERFYPEMDRWYVLQTYPSESGLSVFSKDISERKRVERELTIHLSQQAVVAELGELAVSGIAFRELAEMATARLSDTLGVEYTKVLELLPEGEELLLLAGVGWREGYVGHARVPADVQSQAGYTLATSRPVVVTDFQTETRFGCPDLLTEHGVSSGMSVVIKADDGSYGVLGAHTSQRREFTQDDINFLESIANILAETNRSQTLLVKLQMTNEQLNLLSQRLVNAQETERKRIVHELHDQIGQSLTAVKITLESLKRSFPKHQADQAVNDSIDMIGRALAKVRTLSFSLRPAMLDDLGLVPTLRWYLDQQANLGGFEVKLTAAPPDLTLVPFLEANCFRVVQEAVTNIHRHAKANLVEVGLRVADGHAELRIKDDGVGFNSAEALDRSHAAISLGLAGMRERALLIGGELRINSEPGKGTEIILSFPNSE